MIFLPAGTLLALSPLSSLVAEYQPEGLIIRPTAATTMLPTTAGRWFEPLRPSDSADPASSFAKFEKWNGKCVWFALGKIIFCIRQAFSKSVSSRLWERNHLR